MLAIKNNVMSANAARHLGQSYDGFITELLIKHGLITAIESLEKRRTAVNDSQEPGESEFFNKQTPVGPKNAEKGLSWSLIQGNLSIMLGPYQN